MTEPQKDYVPATLDGLHQWLKHEYEHLGWNTLMSLEKGNPAKGLAYLRSLEKLGTAIQERKELNKSNPNVMRDLEVLEWKLGKLVKMVETLGIQKDKLKGMVCSPITETAEGTATATGTGVLQQGGKKTRKSSKKSSKKPSKKSSKKTQKGGAKKRVSKKSSKKYSKKSSKK